MVKRLAILDVERCVGCQSCMFACVRRTGHGGLEGTCIHVQSAGGIRKGFIVIVCRACPEPSCMGVCPTDAITMRNNSGIHIQPEKCIGCGNCLEACPFGAISWNKETTKPIVCVYCGYCASYCPYDVIAMEEVA